jgi:hypothetical protein
MKMKSIFRIMMLMVAAAILIAGCTKETSEVRLDPKLGTTKVSDITSNSATVTGFVVAEGDGFLTRGVCYDKQPGPTTASPKTPYPGPLRTAAFNVTLTDLDYAQTYYARAFAMGPAGTVYGEELTFTTKPILATVTTDEATDVEGTTATTGGEVTADGGAAVTAKGVVYGTSPAPTIAGNKTTDGDGVGAFVSSLTGLSGLTTYYARAYATNSAGTAYGNEITFTTLVSVREWYVPGDYVAASYPGSGLADWSPDKSPMVKSNEANPNNVEGYVYMANGSNNWKFASKPNWDGPNYGAGSAPGTLDPSGGDISLPGPAYYKLNVNAGADPMTYTAVAMNWGVIGGLTGWSSQLPLTYDPAVRVWKGGIRLTAGEWKFRANDSWDYNYGADAGSNVLVAGGGNINTTVEDDYAITLDLSTPLAYTYRADRWGIIGNATGSWDVDQNMAWDNVNKVFTATIDLVVGEIKFRANDDWGYNFGGDLGSLSEGGANIQIAEAGNYTITLDPWSRVATVTKN